MEDICNDPELRAAAEKVTNAILVVDEEELDKCLMEEHAHGGVFITRLAGEFDLMWRDYLALKASDILPKEALRRGKFSLRNIGLACALYVARHHVQVAVHVCDVLSKNKTTH